MQTFRKDTTLTDFGYITTPLYPLPLTAPVNCSTIFIVPHGCHYLRLWFLDFVIDSSNYLVVSSVPYSGKLSGSSAILDVGGDSITMGIQFVKMTRASAQRIALMYRCCKLLHSAYCNLHSSHAAKYSCLNCSDQRLVSQNDSELNVTSAKYSGAGLHNRQPVFCSNRPAEHTLSSS